MAFIRAHKNIIKLQVDGLTYVRDTKGLGKKGVEDLTAEADYSVSKGPSGLGRSLDKSRVLYVKGWIKLLTKNIAFIGDRYLKGTLVRLKHRRKVTRTARHHKDYLLKREEHTKKFLR